MFEKIKQYIRICIAKRVQNYNNFFDTDIRYLNNLLALFMSLYYIHSKLFISWFTLLRLTTKLSAIQSNTNLDICTI